MVFQCILLNRSNISRWSVRLQTSTQIISWLDEKFRHRSGWRGEARSVQLVMSVPFLLVMFDYWFRGEVGILFHSCAIFNPSILDKIMFPWPRTALESWVGAGGVDWFTLPVFVGDEAGHVFAVIRIVNFNRSSALKIKLKLNWEKKSGGWGGYAGKQNELCQTQ